MTYCVAVKTDIVVSTCPLQKGHCYWQHRETHQCQYTEEDLDVQTFAQRVGLKAPSDADRVHFFNNLKTALKDL